MLLVLTVSTLVALLADGHGPGAGAKVGGRGDEAELQSASREQPALVIKLSSHCFGFICQEVSVVSSGCS